MKTLPFALCAYFLGAHDPRVPGKQGRLIGIGLVGEYVQIEESQFFRELGNLSGSQGLV